MNRLCERPGCSAPAEAAYGFDADLLIVWLGALVAAEGLRYGVLCRRHADAMIVPLGWMLDDRREVTPGLFRAPAAAAPTPRPRQPRRVRRDDTEQLTLDASSATATRGGDALDEPADPAAIEQYDTLGELVVDEVAVADDLAAHAWIPVFDQHDDLHGLLNARGRLLSRAFNGAPADDP